MKEPMIALLILMTVSCMAYSEAERDVEKEILIKFKAGVPQEKIDLFIGQNQLEVIERYTLMENLFLCRILKEQNAKEFIQKFEKSPDIDYMEENQEVRALNES